MTLKSLKEWKKEQSLQRLLKEVGEELQNQPPQDPNQMGPGMPSMGSGQQPQPHVPPQLHAGEFVMGFSIATYQKRAKNFALCVACIVAFA